MKTVPSKGFSKTHTAFQSSSIFGHSYLLPVFSVLLKCSFTVISSLNLSKIRDTVTK